MRISAPRRAVPVLAVAVVLACACSGPDEGGTTGGPGDPLPLPTTLAGGVGVIQTFLDDGAEVRSAVTAGFTDGVPPTSLAVVATEGECTLLVGSTRDECAALMDAAEVESCGLGCRDGTCLEYPAPLHSGTIGLSGLTTTVTLTPGGMGAWYAANAFDDEAPLFRAGAPVRATSAGGAVPAFDLEARGVPRLDGTIAMCRAPIGHMPGVVCLQDGRDLAVAWKPSGDNPPGGRVFLRFSSGWHGSPGLTMIWCDSLDDGEITVPASLLDRYPAVSGGINESSAIGRMSAATLDLPTGPIALQVVSQQQFLVTRDHPPSL